VCSGACQHGKVLNPSDPAIDPEQHLKVEIDEQGRPSILG
jgi:hypothetical protein